MYGLKNYKSQIIDENFNVQYNCIPNNIINQTLYLSKSFLYHIITNHTKNSEYLAFETYDIYFTDRIEKYGLILKKIKKLYKYLYKKISELLLF